MLGAGQVTDAIGDLLFDLGHAHGALANVVGKGYRRVADEVQDGVSVLPEAMQEIGRHGLFAASAQTWRRRSFRLKRFTFSHQGVVHSAEGGDVVGVEHALLTPRRSMDPVSAEQQLHH